MPQDKYDKLLDKQIESQEKVYMESYKKSVLLIKNAPNIIFRPSRIEVPEQSIKYTSYQIPISSCDTDAPLIIFK